MYIQFCEFFDILRHFLKPNPDRKKNEMFDLLFASVTKDKMPDKTEVSKIVHNHRPVPKEIRKHYAEKGIGQLAADIREHVFPKLTSSHEFADRLYWKIQQDSLLQGLLKHTVAENYPPEEEGALALYIATVLYTIIHRPIILVRKTWSQSFLCG